MFILHQRARQFNTRKGGREPWKDVQHKALKEIPEQDLKELTTMFLALSSDKVRWGVIRHIEAEDPVMADYLYEVMKIKERHTGPEQPNTHTNAK